MNRRFVVAPASSRGDPHRQEAGGHYRVPGRAGTKASQTSLFNVPQWLGLQGGSICATLAAIQSPIMTIVNIPVLRTLVLSVALAAASVFGQVPGIISHQGKITVGGNSFTDTGYFKFALVHTNVSAITDWSNDGTSTAGGEPTAAVSLAVSRGIFSVNLGDTTLANMTTIPASVFANSAVYLRVWFNDGTTGWSQLTPDRRITSVGYALKAASADAVATPPGMVLIPAGAFTMGNSIAADTDITDAATNTVTVSAFYMDVNLVTLSQWQSVYYWATNQGYGFVNAGAGKAANHPVQTVNWYDCVKWCNARSQQAGKTLVYYTDAALTKVYTNGAPFTLYPDWTASGYRLPTEAEWEKAARGGLSGQRFPWGNVINQNLANYYGITGTYAYDLGPNGYNPIGSIGGTAPATSPVGSFAANGYGLNDMAGNVLQWCWDLYATPYAGGSDPHGPVGGGYARVFRGGDWAYYAAVARCALRSYYWTSGANDTVGFRCVRGL